MVLKGGAVLGVAHISLGAAVLAHLNFRISDIDVVTFGFFFNKYFASEAAIAASFFCCFDGDVTGDDDDVLMKSVIRVSDLFRVFSFSFASGSPVIAAAAAGGGCELVLTKPRLLC